MGVPFPFAIESVVVGRSARMRAVFDIVRVVSTGDSTVLAGSPEHVRGDHSVKSIHWQSIAEMIAADTGADVPRPPGDTWPDPSVAFGVVWNTSYTQFPDCTSPTRETFNSPPPVDYPPLAVRHYPVDRQGEAGEHQRVQQRL